MIGRGVATMSEPAVDSVSARWTLPDAHFYGKTVPDGPWHIFDSEERRSLCGVYNSEGVTRGSNRGLEPSDLPSDVCGSCVGKASYLEPIPEDSEKITTKCERCGGEGVLTGERSGSDTLRCPDCLGDGEVQKPVSELDVEYCPWCDEEQPHANNRCVECGSDE